MKLTEGKACKQRTASVYDIDNLSLPEHCNFKVNTCCDVYTRPTSKCCDNTYRYAVGTAAGNVCIVLWLCSS